jgi:hypothetical protein
VITEPTNWGEDGSTLLPVEIKRYLSSAPVAKKKRRSKKDDLYAISEQDLISTNNWSKFSWETSPTLTAANIFARIISENGEEILGFPFFQLSSFVTNVTFADIPLTIKTWGTLSHLGLNSSDRCAELLDQPVEVWYQELQTQLDNSELDICEAILDVLITSRSWLYEDRVKMTLLSHPQLSGDSMHEILEIAAYRTLRSCGHSPEKLDLSRYDWALALRLGLHPTGKTTLEAAASVARLTRERIRQITLTIAEPSHSVIRRWKLPKALIDVRSEFEQCREISDNFKQTITRHFPKDWEEPFELLERVFDAYGHDSPYVFLDSGEIILSNDIRNVAGNQFLTEIERICENKCGDLGFLIKSEVMAELMYQSHGLSEQSLLEAVDSCLSIPNLPLGYGFFEKAGPRQKIFNITSKMLNWVGRLNVDEIKIGLERNSRFRRSTAPPPSDVLLGYFQQTPGFHVDNRAITLQQYSDPESDTVEGIIANLIQESSGLVVTKSQIFDHFRKNKTYSSSASVYLSFSPLFKTVGRACVTLIGATPSSEQIEDAENLSAALTINSDLEIFFYEDKCELKLLIGTNLRNSGTFAGTKQLRLAIGESKFKVMDKNKQSYGNLSCSNKNIIYSLSSLFNAKKVEIGNSITLEIDFTNFTVILKSLE